MLCLGNNERTGNVFGHIFILMFLSPRAWPSRSEVIHLPSIAGLSNTLKDELRSESSALLALKHPAFSAKHHPTQSFFPLSRWCSSFHITLNEPSPCSCHCSFDENPSKVAIESVGLHAQSQLDGKKTDARWAKRYKW